MNINWQSEQSYLFLNPRTLSYLNIDFPKVINKFNLQSHILLATSGSTAINPADIKLVALKKSAILISSESVNKHLNCNANDVILNPLPHFHIGGLSTFSRSYLSGAKLINLYSENMKWNPFHFKKEIELNKVTITSLVPTQVFDLVQNNCLCPASLKAVVVGGGSLSYTLYEKAKFLGWPLLPSYGMTECCSQVATAERGFLWNYNSLPELKILDHIYIRTMENGKICISGDSLLTGYIFLENGEFTFFDCKNNFPEDSFDEQKYILTSDVGNINNSYLQIIGRSDDVVKISGESVSLNRLDNILTDVKSDLSLCEDMAIISKSDFRLENKICLVLNNKSKNNENFKNRVLSEFNKRCFPFEKIKEVYYVDHIPRTNLGKLKRTQLLSNINFICNS
ncbi:AMP-binding protein [Silvanigrella aquatica]|uniref:AMP-dependent synthetase/ligase domain-containing protein n=1 Tax=Silvanigrella aquatica TaxID=1915309 RepID=A0A1L4D3Y4_9BACT|nr:AMP-binding protein [Silvanigrella aquatica]APJ04926.1 hypothetical protein AXG55_13890 [Silvanigrella aquatica]